MKGSLHMVLDNVLTMTAFDFVMLFFVVVSCHFSYKKGMRKGIEKTVDWMEEKGHISLKKE